MPPILPRSCRLYVSLAPLAALLALASSSAGCGGDCTAEARAGLRVVVTDADTEARICDAEVTAVDGSYEELLFAYGDPNCSYQGVFERTGNYFIVVNHPDYVSGKSALVEVPSDGCHVELQDVALSLEPSTTSP